MLERELSEYHASIAAGLEDKSPGDTGLVSSLGASSGKFHCTGGKDPSKMSEMQYLEEFKNGNCSPLIAIAGIMGTKLQVEIDCNTMKEQNNEVFKKCGWTTCGFTIFGRKPNREYDVWIPSLISPFSILSPFQSQRTFSAVY